MPKGTDDFLRGMLWGMLPPVVWMVVFTLCVTLAVALLVSFLRRQRHTRSMMSTVVDDPRFGAEQPAQIVGVLCTHCARPFVIAEEAAACVECASLTHRGACAEEHAMHAHAAAHADYRNSGVANR
jgi:hypothetical protein